MWALVPCPGIEPRPSASGQWRLSHWPAGKPLPPISSVITRHHFISLVCEAGLCKPSLCRGGNGDARSGAQTGTQPPGLHGPGSLALHPPGGRTQDETPAPRSFQLCLLPLPQAQGAIDPIWLPYQHETAALLCHSEPPGSVKRSLVSLSTLEKCI